VRATGDGLLQRLREAQRRDPQHHLSSDALREAAGEFDVSLGHVRGVTTFYSMLSERPRGRHIVRVCESPPCRLVGGDDLLDGLCTLLHVRPGETTTDGEFTVELSSCLGACDQGPSLLLDDALMTQVQPDSLAGILDAARGRPWIGPPSMRCSPMR
jgi:NADH-quinone oxidoreductase subunit E